MMQKEVRWVCEHCDAVHRYTPRSCSRCGAYNPEEQERLEQENNEKD